MKTEDASLMNASSGQAAGETPALQAQALSWHAQGLAIVDGVSLSVGHGEMLGLIGPNGSGKSTLLRLLSGILRPSQGHVEMAGQRMDRLARREVAQQLALVSQQADTLDAITAEDAVELGRTPWLSALQSWSEHDTQIVHDALRAVDMFALRKRRWGQLSGGEHQRIHIARALAQQPRILILDEPANHLDIHQQLALMALVRRLPITIVMAIHDLNQAQCCDRLAVMRGGRLVAHGKSEDVLQAELIEQVFGVSMRALVDPEDGSRILRFQPLSEAARTPHRDAGHETTSNHG